MAPHFSFSLCTLYGLFPFGPGAEGHTQILEEIPEQPGTFFLQHALLHLGMVVEIHGKQIAHRAAAAGLGIRRAVDHPGDPGIYDGTGAHRAGFQRHIQGTTTSCA